MAYVPLTLACSNSKVAAAISMATERNLKQVHFLLATPYSRKSPHDHFRWSAVIMTVLTIAAASSIRYFDPKLNRNSQKDGPSFRACVNNFFPWDHVTISDYMNRPMAERRKAAGNQLYSLIRNPLVHSGGVIGKGYPFVQVSHKFPGLPSSPENKRAIAQLCGMASLNGQILFDMATDSLTVHTQPLYWCARKMIEAFAANSRVQADIVNNLSI